MMLGRLLVLALFAVRAVVADDGVPSPPDVLVDGWSLTLIDSEPGLVTPTGCCVGTDGAVYVIECHTHFPPDDYAGPKFDRILRYTDSDGDGIVDESNVFASGSARTMNIVSGPDNWFIYTTRSEVVRIRDSNGDGQADERETLLRHETPGDYPHNGLGGLALGPDDHLYVGQGENLGEPYTLVGTDGSQQVGHGEGGNVFRCTIDGGSVERVATGFWNPFGLAFDGSGRLLAVGNDPDSMPPNRLMHVVETGDYGFQFRFGRAGIHPLQSWNGEFPGTLPIAAATGEAACAVLIEGRTALVSSWGDNRIELLTLKSMGASVAASSQVVIQGQADFRPVGMARAKDGAIYMTDWVDRSYPVHGQGRLWRLARTSLPDTTPLPLSEREEEARKLTTAATLGQLLEAANSKDGFLRQAAISGLVAGSALEDTRFGDINSPRQKVSLLTAHRWKQFCDPSAVSGQQRQTLLRKALKDEADAVVLAAIRWTTENRDKELSPLVADLLQREELSERLFAAAIASLAYLDNGSASPKGRDPAIERRLVSFLLDESRPASLRALALRRLPSESKIPSNDELHTLTLTSSSVPLHREVVRFLAARKSGNWPDRLAMVARNSNVDSQTRADAMTYLLEEKSALKTVVDSLATSRDPILLTSVARLAAHSVDSTSFPDVAATDEWMKLVGTGGDPEAGRRVFVQRTCIHCHQHAGRGASTGPDLTSLAGQMPRRRILESILEPSREIGPMYVPWTVVTRDGRSFSGFKLDRPGKGGALRYVDVKGKVIEVRLKDIDSRSVSNVSLMPKGLERSMSVEELRDLLAFLSAS